MRSSGASPPASRTPARTRVPTYVTVSTVPVQKPVVGRAGAQPAGLDGGIDRGARGKGVGARRQQAAVVQADQGVLVGVLLHAAGQEVGRAEEVGDERGLGPLEQLAWGVELVDQAVAHHRDPVGQDQRLFLIVRHVDDGQAEFRWMALISTWSWSRSFLSSAPSGSSMRMTGGR